jgi:polyphosphate kinase
VDRQPDSFIDRELSWLDFNVRVLELAEDQSLPLLERVKFLAIFSSNLDEFFMVRVANLKRRIELGQGNPESMSAPSEILREIRSRVKELNKRVHYLLAHDLDQQLIDNGIVRETWDSLSDSEQQNLTKKFLSEILPILTPLAVDPAHPFPHISGLSLNLGMLIHEPNHEPRLVRVKVPPNLSRLIRLNENENSYILLEDVISEHLSMLLPGVDVEDFYFFRVTRNQDLELDEDETDDLLSSVEDELLKRKFGAPVRLEVEIGVDNRLLERLIEELEISKVEVYKLAPPLDLTLFFEMYKFDLPQLKYGLSKSILPRPIQEVQGQGADAFFSKMRDGEILLHHPRHSFTGTVVKFLELAAADPKVLAIKQTLYRTSGDSPIIDALIDAARSGKQVLAVIELRARFDEQANVKWAKQLEDAGVHVVFGVINMKTHAKASLIIRREESGLVTYSHMGTGNYNPSTARFYDDLGLLSADQVLGRDLIALFNQISSLTVETDYQRILVAPNYLKQELINLIRREAENHLSGQAGLIRFKMNSLVDHELIEELYLASKKGVQIELVVRGICSFRMSEVAKYQNVRIRSILGRFLEHSRIYSFRNSGNPEFFIGSADLMDRNLNRRIETLVRVEDLRHKGYLDQIFSNSFSDSILHWWMDDSDKWRKSHGLNIDMHDYQSEEASID